LGADVVIEEAPWSIHERPRELTPPVHAFGQVRDSPQSTRAVLADNLSKTALPALA
jgi:hypothetical protein